MKKDEIKGIIFDLGGVLVSDIGGNFFEKVSKTLGISETKARTVIKKEEGSFQRGEESVLDFWYRVCEKLKVARPKDRDLVNLSVNNYDKLAKIDYEMIDLAKRLRKKYKLAILSNTIEEHAKINRKRKLFEHFDKVFLSNEMGLRKPEREFFEKASKELKIPFENLLFVDDEMRWVKVARKYGLKAVLFKNRQQLEKQLEKFQIFVN